MQLHIRSHLHYQLKAPCPLLLQIEAAATDDQSVISTTLDHNQISHLRRVKGDEGIGHRVWLDAAGEFICTYNAIVAITRPDVDWSALPQTPLSALPGSVIKYLMPSRYCHPERFFDVTARDFGGMSGGARIAAFADWIKENIRYDIYASDPTTDAFHSYERRAGVCRDFAHMLIAMARAVAIPARFVSAYGQGVNPQDFHALTEVYLDGGWYPVDPTGMTTASDTVCIGVGRDAADASFLTSYGWVDLVDQSVTVERMDT